MELVNKNNYSFSIYVDVDFNMALEQVLKKTSFFNELVLCINILNEAWNWEI